MRHILMLVVCGVVFGCQCLQPVSACAENVCDAGVDGPVLGAGGGAAADGGSNRDAGYGGGAGGDPGQDGGTCERWDGGGIGRCAAITGYVFRGTECWGECVVRPITTPGVFEDLPTCVRCGCDTSKFRVHPPIGKPLGPDSFCDELVAVTPIPLLLADAFPGYDVDAGCTPEGSVDSRCTLWQRHLGDAGYARACAATLVARVSEVRCIVFIP
jgi:hypothetical protein